MILEYLLGNSGPDTISIKDAGIYIDWELSDKFENRSWYNDSQQALITTNGDSTLWSGLGLFTDMYPHFLALDLEEKNGNQSDLEVNSFEDDDL